MFIVELQLATLADDSARRKLKQPAAAAKRSASRQPATRQTTSAPQPVGAALVPASTAAGDSWLQEFLESDDPPEASDASPPAAATATIDLVPMDPPQVLEEEEEAGATIDMPGKMPAAAFEATTDFALAPLDDEPQPTADLAAPAKPQAIDSPAVAAATIDRATIDMPAASTARERSAPQVAATADAHNHPTTAAAGPSPVEELPTTLGGYRLVEELGRGAMGAVYRANQLSLNREVAVKVIQPHLASDPYYVARFTREAYAAAQLTHHNVVQIYDLGASRNLRYFSMELVRGRNLGQLLQEQGRLNARDAAGYLLQAARGLKFAHDHGLVHRDIKPENLMLSDDGLVKVADLGLVKAAKEDDWRGDASTAAAAAERAGGGGMTMAHAAMGTPAYMPPEQADNAAGVDHRADIYSLGCTFYTLLAGRPPFSGKTVVEIMTKHKSGQFTPPHVAVDGLPEEIAELTTRMMARRPDDRQRDLGEVIATLVRYLGQAAEHYSPRREHIATIENSAAAFRDVPLARVGAKLWGGFAVVCLLLLLVGAAVLGGPGAGFAVGLAMIAPVAYGLVRGTRRKSPLVAQLREYAIASGPSWWLRLIAFVLLAGGLLYLAGWLVPWIVAIAAAIGVAVAVYELVDKRIVRARREPLDSASDLIRRLRSRGVEEAAIQRTIAEHVGDQWEEFYEALFGYPAKLTMRSQINNLAGREADAIKHAAWRDPLIAWLQRRIAALRSARERRMLAKIERVKLRAGGLSAGQARQRAAAAADAIVDQAAELKQLQRAGGVDAAHKRQVIKGMLMAARLGTSQPVTWKQRQLAAVGRGVDWALGVSARLLVGLVLIVGCTAWMDQNGLIPWRPLEAVSLEQLHDVPRDQLAPVVEHMALYYGEPMPLVIDGLPPEWTGLFYGYGSGLAGIALVLSALCGGRWVLLFVLPAAFILAFGELFLALPSLHVPGFGDVPSAWLHWTVGGGLVLLGLIVSHGGER